MHIATLNTANSPSSGRSAEGCKSLAGTLLLLQITTVFARDPCTPDANFSYCRWGQVSDCRLLDEKLLQSDAVTEAERGLIVAVRARTLGERVFDLRSLAQEFGSKAIKDSPAPGITIITWVRDTPGSELKTTIGFVSEKERIQIASVSVPGKFIARWCAKLLP